MSNAFYYQTKVGKIVIVENGNAITHLYFGESIPKDARLFESALLKKAGKELLEYFLGKRKTFDLPLEPKGTEFQNKVWRSLLEIPYGRTSSYKDIANNLGNVNASRAVGMANGKNPILIFIPCHRVIGTSGKLVGYAGGLEVKEKLLEMERDYEES